MGWRKANPAPLRPKPQSVILEYQQEYMWTYLQISEAGSDKGNFSFLFRHFSKYSSKIVFATLPKLLKFSLEEFAGRPPWNSNFS